MNLLLLAVTLLWTAPGDDGQVGTAAAYDLRYASDSATVAGWGSATQATGEPAPKAAGTSESFQLNLSQGTWWFGLRTRDEAGNESATSNIVKTIIADTTPPGVVLDLRVGP